MRLNITAPFKKQKMLGVAHGKRRYDLPLDKNEGTGFLVLLIGMMTIMAVLALAASFALGGMAERWAAGLQNQATAEIPAENKEGAIRSREDMQDLAKKAAESLGSHPAVATLRILGDDEIAALVSPWLGDNLLMNNIPLPSLIEIELQEKDEHIIKILQDRLQKIAPEGRIDSHEEWLHDLVRFIGALQFAATMILLVVGITTVTAVAGGVRSRMAVNRTEVELLHLMGASDHYIARQFQRHSLIIALQGALAGLLAGALCLMLIGWIAGEIGVNLLPDFSMSNLQIGILAALPLVIGLIATVTAGKTVLNVLTKMP